jgi:hypothetical protein
LPTGKRQKLLGKQPLRLRIVHWLDVIFLQHEIDPMPNVLPSTLRVLLTGPWILV